MEFAALPFFGKFAAVAVAVALIIEMIKKVPYFDKFFFDLVVVPPQDGKPAGVKKDLTRRGKTVLLVLPFVLGILGAFILFKLGLVNEFIVGGVCAGGLSGFGYDIVKNTLSKKVKESASVDASEGSPK